MRRAVRAWIDWLILGNSTLLHDRWRLRRRWSALQQTRVDLFENESEGIPFGLIRDFKLATGEEASMDEALFERFAGTALPGDGPRNVGERRDAIA